MALRQHSAPGAGVTGKPAFACDGDSILLRRCYFGSSIDRGSQGEAGCVKSRPGRNRCPSYSTGGAFYVHRACCLAPIFITESGSLSNSEERTVAYQPPLLSKEYLKSAHADRYQHGTDTRNATCFGWASKVSTRTRSGSVTTAMAVQTI